MVEVILGLPGPWADDYLEAADHYTTKIGGLPDWPFPDSSLECDLLKCNRCKSDLCLVSQVYAPITSGVLTIEERVIFVFVCKDAHCGSWRAIRVQKPDKYVESEPASSEVAPSVTSSISTSNSKWWDDLCSFESDDEDSGDDEDISLEELSRAFSEAASLASSSAKRTSKKHTKTNGKSISVNSKAREVDSSELVLPCFYIYSQTDRSSKGLSAVCSSSSSLSIKENQYLKVDNDQAQEEVWENEEYEYDKALNADRTYLKFKKRIDACPEQCLRYSYGGKPLLATGNATNPGKCSLCGEPRHYEMQLMPPLVYFLQEAAAGQQKDLLDNWSWLTLLVYTCSKSCFEKSGQGMSQGHDWTVVEEAGLLQSE